MQKEITNFLIQLIGTNKPREAVLPQTVEAEKSKFQSDLKNWYDSNRLLHTENSRETRKSLDEALLTLSSASLGIGIAVVQFVNGIVVHPFLMVISWICFGFTISITLVSHAVSEALSDMRLADVEKDYSEICNRQSIKIELVDHGHSWEWFAKLRKKLTEIFTHNMLELLNLASLLSFISGVVLLSIFCWTNFLQKQERYMSEDNVKNEQQQLNIRQEKPKDLEEHGFRPSQTSPKPAEPKPTQTQSETQKPNKSDSKTK